MTNGDSQNDANPLEDLSRRIEAMIGDAEAHLGVPPGTLGDIRHDTDYLAIVKMHATIEPLLNDALEESVTRALKHPKVAFPGGDALAEVILGARFDEKVRLALESELISDPNAAFIRAVAKLRNFYAHNVSNMPKKIPEAAEARDKQQGGLSLLRDLMAASPDMKRKVDREFALSYVRPIMFLHFASLLGVLMQGIRPPPSFSEVMKGLLHADNSEMQEMTDE